jgi:hypothetical protein
MSAKMSCGAKRTSVASRAAGSGRSPSCPGSTAPPSDPGRSAPETGSEAARQAPVIRLAVADRRTDHPPRTDPAAHQPTQQTRPCPGLPRPLQLRHALHPTGRPRAPHELRLREHLHRHNRRMRRPPRTDHPIRLGPPKTHHMPGRHIIGIKQRLVLRPPTEHSKPGIARVLQNRPDRTPLPTIRKPMPILLRPPRRRTRHPSRFRCAAIARSPIPSRYSVKIRRTTSAAGSSIASSRYPSAALRAFGCGPSSTTTYP